MSVESKIKELLGRVDVKASLNEAEQMGASSVSKDSSISPKNSGDSSSPKQGDSEDASYEERNEKDANQGAITAKGISKNTIAMKAPVGDAPNFTTVQGTPNLGADWPAIPMNSGIREEEEVEEEEIIIEDDEVTDETVAEDTEENLQVDISAIFGEDLSEEFKQKASSIFEAAVIAKVNDEMERVTQALEERYSAEFEEYKEGIVEKVDAYLNYVVENYMEENKLAVEQGLRTEIAEDFMAGLKVLFKEHYIEVPEEKYDVIGDLQSKVTELEEGLNYQLEQNVSLNAEVISLRKNAIVAEMSKDLAHTDAKRLSKLLEGVDFDNEGLYKEKVAVIKENYFSVTDIKKPSEMMTQPLLEETTVQESFESNDAVSSYAKALSRTIKRV
jgi:hypothetical protein